MKKMLPLLPLVGIVAFLAGIELYNRAQSRQRDSREADQAVEDVKNYLAQSVRREG